MLLASQGSDFWLHPVMTPFPLLATRGVKSDLYARPKHRLSG